MDTAVSNPREITQSLLYLDGVSVSFDGFKALNNLSLSIDIGELRCVIGPNGAGKSTFFNCLTGVIRPTSGATIPRGSSDRWNGRSRPYALSLGEVIRIPLEDLME